MVAALGACARPVGSNGAPPKVLSLADLPPGGAGGELVLAAPDGAPPPPAGPAPARRRASEDPEDLTVYRVPLGNSPVRGKPTALVTIVEFSDFECPFCSRVQPTLAAIQQKYGDKVRFVFKHEPLPFHEHAEPSAELVTEARAQKGDLGFWKAHDLIFGLRGRIEDEDLREVAKQVGLDPAAAMRSVETRKHQKVIEDDLDLADEVNASGTPHFFINGRRIVGAQPLSAFEELIDGQLAVAQAAVARGVAPVNLYETLQKDAAEAPPLPRVTLPAPAGKFPTRGPANAKVVIEAWSDFDCPYCLRSEHTLQALDAAFPGKIKVVWHNYPLDIHPQAELTAEAAMEAFAQKGSDGFWRMHAMIFDGQHRGGHSRQELEGFAKALHLDMGRFGKALDSEAHRAAIEADVRVAQSVGFNSTPTFSINGYRLTGAQPLGKFRRVVKLILGEK